MARHRITSPSAPAYDATRLDELGARVPEALDLVSNVLECAVEAIDRQDVALARMVVGDDDYIDARYVELNVGIVSLLGRRSLDGVALRATMALLGVNRHVERIADLCVNLAKLVLLDGSDPPTDAVMLDKLGRMGSLAQRQLCQAKVAFAERDVALAEQLVSQDDELNRLNRDCFRRALEIGEDANTREWAMHMMLAARWLERIGDNAVDIGEAAVFISTGRPREFASWNPPVDRSATKPRVRHSSGTGHSQA